MEGYVRNVSPIWRHAMKRQIGPGQDVSLEELYLEYGEKHGLERGDVFAQWLRNVKLRDKSIWKIVYDSPPPKEEGSEESEVVVEQIIESEPVVKDDVIPTKINKDMSSTPAIIRTVTTPEDLVNLSVRQAKDVLKNITDSTLLKQSLLLCKTMPNKESLFRMIKKRVSLLDISRR